MGRRSSSSAALAGLFLVVGACGGGSTPTQVVVYSAHDLAFSEPILGEFERRTGIDVRVVGDTEATKTTGLVNRLIQMGARPEADVFWNGEVMNSVRLAELGLLEPFVPASAADIPAAQRDPAGRWFGFGARARVILYNRELVAPEEAPRSLFDLTAERFRGRVAIGNPLFGTTATHAAALFQVLGAERAQEFFRALAANECRVAAGNAAARNLVAAGEVAVCLTDSDDANGAFLAGKPVELVYPDQDGLGTLVIPNTVMLLRGAPHPAEGRLLVEYLASREVEQLLARSASAQMPLRAGLAPHSARFDLAGFRAMTVDWSEVARLQGECTLFLREVFLR